MLEKLFLDGYFDYRLFLLNNFKELGLKSNDLLLLLYLLKEYKNNNKTIIIEELVDNLSLTEEEINNSLSNLLENSFYTVILVNKQDRLEEQISIEPFLKKVEAFFTLEDDGITNKQIFSLIEQKSKKLLTASDYENIDKLLIQEKYSYEDIKQTIEYLEKAKLNITVRNIIKHIDKKQVKQDSKSRYSEAVDEVLNLLRNNK